MDPIKWFSEISRDDLALVGGKAGNLGEMYAHKFPVPPGFVVTTDAFKTFLVENDLTDPIAAQLTDLDVADSDKLQSVAKHIQDLILDAKMPQQVRAQIAEAYGYMSVDPSLRTAVGKDALSMISSGRTTPFVAVRSSATVEDLEGASFAGQQATFVNVKGVDAVLQSVQQCWASLYTARAIYYRVKNNFAHEKVFIAVVVQKMINSEVSGVVFTAEPSTGNTDTIVLEAGLGLGDAVVAGEITPDHYEVSKSDFLLTKKKLGAQAWMYTRDGMSGATIKKELTVDRGSRQKLSDSAVVFLAKECARIEAYYAKPMDIEFAYEAGKLFIVQARPITTLGKKEVAPVVEETARDESASAEKLLEGLAASPGVVSGPVKILAGPHELAKVEKGDVLVATMTSPDYVPAIERAVAVVTDEGGMTSHASIVSREMGIPCVVGTEEATKKLTDGQVVTVDGSSGIVLSGAVAVEQKPVETPAAVHESEPIVTATKVYMNLAEPEKIDAYAHLPFDGIGLLRLEFLITSTVKAHPLYLIAQGRQQEFVDALVAGVSKVARAIYPRPVVVRFSDFKTNEYKNLEGGEAFEPHEANPMLGWRGVSRYISPQYKDAFALECEAIKTIREKGLTNVHVMLPFVRTREEVSKCLEILSAHSLDQSLDFHIWIMAEVPAVALLAEEFAQLPIAGCSIGSNDLTQGVLCVDRDSARLGKLHYFDERNEAVLCAMKNIISGFIKHGKTVSFCGQAVSVYPELAEFLVGCKITSVSVNPDAVVSVREHIASIERKLLLSSVLQ